MMHTGRVVGVEVEVGESAVLRRVGVVGVEGGGGGARDDDARDGAEWCEAFRELLLHVGGLEAAREATDVESYHEKRKL